MNFTSDIFGFHRLTIETHRNQGLTWEQIINMEFLTDADNDREKFLENLSLASGQQPISVGEWEQLVLYIKNLNKKVELNKLGRTIKNNARIPTDQFSAWQLYKRNIAEKGFSGKSIDEIEQSSINILQSLSVDTKETGPVKGLVIGNVQSGKTANMAGLMAMAADYGFNYFIVLSGVIESLRKQTATRLFEDMNAYGNGKWNWRHIENPRLCSTIIDQNLSQFNLSLKSRDRYFSVCLKNRSRLQELYRWLKSDLNKTRQLKVLIIDDEADQASINTKNKDQGDYTAINGLIRNLVNDRNFAGMNYISYTATPYANVLNETSEDSLYPKDFIALLETSEDYIGPKELFGMKEPEKSPGIDIVLQISEQDAEIVREIQNGNAENQMLPNSFINAIQWFLITVACMRKLQYKKPVSMLVHTSFRVHHHEIIADKIKEYLYTLKYDFNNIKNEMKKLYESEKESLTLENFKESMNGYSSLKKVPNYPEWSDIVIELEKILKVNQNNYVTSIQVDEDGSPVYHEGIHLVIDNSRANLKGQNVRLVYPKKQNLPDEAPAFIVVGGNTLSRGLTLEGLTTTYFLRTTNQADTLMQMGRWFGYRKGYELFPRVWMDWLAQERFNFLSQMNEELRDEIRGFVKNGSTPMDYAPRIKNSPNYKLIRITANNKSQSAEHSEFDFAGFNSQTVYFENNLDTLKNNIQVTEQFLNKLNSPKIKESRMIWKDVDKENVNWFLEKYNVTDLDTRMAAIPALIEWLEKEGGEFDNWNVILSSIGDISKENGENKKWNIHGYSPRSVNRSKLIKNSNDKVSSIGVLRTPKDLLIDIEANNINYSQSKISKVQEYRNKYGLSKTPQLLIYRINKDSKPSKNSSEVREPLNFKEDVIGINIMIPSVHNNNKNLATYIQATIDTSARMIDEEEFIDPEEE